MTRPRLVLIEGVPGSGKTSMATALCAHLLESRRPARWCLEEDRQHPVAPATLRRRNRDGNFHAQLLESWARFAAAAGDEELWILEGTAFQSTIRFCYSHERPVSEMRAYLEACWKTVASLHPLFVFLDMGPPEPFVRSFTSEAKSAEWVEKVCAYVARTQIGVARGWSGLDGLAAFWGVYGELCAELAAEVPFPCLRVSLDGWDWAGRQQRVFGWVDDQLK